MLHTKNSKRFVWQNSIVWKIVVMNALVLGIVIWLVGVSVKDFACLLVGQYAFFDQEKQDWFNSTMHAYLLRASLFAVLAAAAIHYLWMRNILIPLHTLMKSTRLMTEGTYPAPISLQSKDEIGQLSGHFNRMVSTLKKTDESRRQMLSDISHELRTPLSNLTGYLEALSSGVIRGEPSLYHSLHDEAVHLTRLVDQFHQLAVWETKRGARDQWQLIEMKAVVQASCQHVDLERSSKQIRIDIDLQPGTVQGDELGLRQVMTNLLQNAVRYDRGGWVRLTGETAGTDYLVTVTNEGQPIPPDQADRIFDRLYRIDPSRHRGTGGSGLGLAIAQEIVQQHGGSIGLRSNGDEHTFWFTIPLAH